MVPHNPSPRAGAGDRHCVLVVGWLDLTLFVSDFKLESCDFLLSSACTSVPHSNADSGRHERLYRLMGYMDSI